ncbi:hypothetical protein BDZ45DRAFT_809089 [Acephala macrosclerotiorum]|nr:hypothetical protein BDZ45DRAFT_809089 [Acephala macrosclerotiorum]
MPHSTLKQAEEAALNGEVSDWDTQNCEDFQKTLLSSPAEPTNMLEQVASANPDAIVDALNIKVEVEVERQIVDDAEEYRDTGEDIPVIIQALLAQQSGPEPEPVPEPEVEAPAEHATPQAAPIQFRRDSRGKLRAYTVAGEERRPPGFEERYQAAIAETRRATAMEDLTQKSSMSLTQENPESAYAKFDIQEAIHDECPSTASPDDGEDNETVPNPPHESVHSKQFSARTESTAYTYGENDTGHVKIDFEPDPMEEEPDDMDDDEPSQDPSFAAPQLGLHFSAPTYDPQTPAAPINPFAHKGSVMKPLDMFGATQPSSIARHRASPTSSRPSPDVYNDFSSPPKRRRIGSSPLDRLQELKDPETSPLQSSVRNILASSDFPDATIPRTSGVQSFDTGPRMSRTSSMPETRPYVSMKESQERRRRMRADSDSDGSDFEGESLPWNKKKEREMRIQREMSSVALPTKRAAFSRPNSSGSPGIEVPSTGRRRSVQDEYLAQCEGFHARDTQQTTQQDDVIADSQGPNQIASAPTFDQEGKDRYIHQSQHHPCTVAESEPDLALSNTPSKSCKATPRMNLPEEGPAAHDPMDVDRQSQAENADATESSLPEPSLPLQEMSGNHLRTPMASKSNVLSDGLIPETSPPEERIRSMGEIAALSFMGETQIDPNDIPGFTQDPNFDEKVVNMSSQLRPAPRPRSFRKNYTASGTSTPVKPASPSQLPEEPPTLSDVPSTLPGQGQPSVGQFVSSPRVPAPNKGVQSEDMPAPQTSVPTSITMPSPEKDAIPEKPMVPAPEAIVPQASQEGTEQEKACTEGESDEVQEEEATANEEDASGVQEEEKAANGEVTYRIQGEIVDELIDKHDNALESGLPTTDSSKLADDPEIHDPPGRRSGLRTKSELKGPSRSLRRSNSKSTATPQPSSRVTKVKAVRKSNAVSTPASTPRSMSEAGPSERATMRSQGKLEKPPTPAPAAHAKRTTKRKLGVTVVDEPPILPTRASKRQSTANLVRDGSEDPLTLTPSFAHKTGRSKSVLFEEMAFAVSYVKNEQERDSVTKLIAENGGRILHDGFDALFNVIPKSAGEDAELSLSESASSLGFTALIADEHSRKAKYMQALALGLPCISGRWISTCVSKMSVVDWTPYLLCAGQSSFLGNAIRSRTIRTYPASDAQLADVFSSRDKLLEGRSVLLVTGKGHSQEKRKAYLFLTRALGPARVGQVVDYQDARKKLAEADTQDQSYDILYVEGSESTADKVVFGPALASGSKKRKRGPTEADADLPAPKKIRIIVDETMVQSLILSQLLEE